MRWLYDTQIRELFDTMYGDFEIYRRASPRNTLNLRLLTRVAKKHHL